MESEVMSSFVHIDPLHSLGCNGRSVIALHDDLLSTIDVLPAACYRDRPSSAENFSTAFSKH